MKFIENLDGLISSKITLVKSLFDLFKLEATLAGLSLYSLLVNLIVLLAFFISTWLTVSLLLGYLVIFFGGNILIAITGVLLLNCLLLIITLKCISTRLKEMSFEKTRAYFSQNHLKDGYELSKKITERHQRDGRKNPSRKNKNKGV